MTNSILTYLLQSSGCLVAFYALYHLLLRQETCFKYNRLYLLGTVTLSFLLPFLELPSFTNAPAFPTFLPSLSPYVVRVPVADGTTTETTLLTWEGVAWLCYGLGCSFFFFRFLRQLYVLQRFIHQHQGEAQKKHGVLLIPTHGQLPTFSFFRYIFWDNSQKLSAEEQERVMQHERVHVTQGHSYDLVFLEVLRIVFWFNPLLLLYQKALTATHEFLADAEVIQTQDKTAYGLLLAQQVLQKADFTFGHYFNTSLTLKRLKMIHNPQRRTSRLKQGLVLPVLGVLVLSLSSNQPLAQQMNLSATGSAQEQTGTTPKASAEPQFPGGTQAMVKFIGQNLRIPASAQKNNEYGGVFIKATIDKNGTPGAFKVVQASHPSLEQEVLRVLKKMPTWEPGTTSATYLFPVSIIIDGFKNDRTAMNTAFNQSLAQVTSQLTNKSVKVAPEVVVVGYGPAE